MGRDKKIKLFATICPFCEETTFLEKKCRIKRIHKHYGSSLNKLIKPFLKDLISSKEEIESFLFKDFVFAVGNNVLGIE